MSRTVVAALVVAGALGLAGFSCGGTQEPPPNPFTCSAQIRGAAGEDLWCVAGTFDYTQVDAGIPEWVIDIPLYRGSPSSPTLPEVVGGVGVFLGGAPALGVPYGWSSGTTNVTSGTGQYSQPPAEMMPTHEAVAPLGDPGIGSFSMTFTRVPAGPTDYLGAHGVVDATLQPIVGSGGSPLPVTLHVVF
jgi:hypothetical protein